jgi:hypothetical protein
MPAFVGLIFSRNALGQVYNLVKAGIIVLGEVLWVLYCGL